MLAQHPSVICTEMWCHHCSILRPSSTFSYFCGMWSCAEELFGVFFGFFTLEKLQLLFLLHFGFWCFCAHWACQADDQDEEICVVVIRNLGNIENVLHCTFEGIVFWSGDSYHRLLAFPKLGLGLITRCSADACSPTRISNLSWLP